MPCLLLPGCLLFALEDILLLSSLNFLMVQEDLTDYCHPADTQRFTALGPDNPALG